MDRAYNNSIFHTDDWLGRRRHRLRSENSKCIRWHPARAWERAARLSAALAFPLETCDPKQQRPGLYINNSTKNVVLNNSIEVNSLVGVYAVGVCTGTLIKGNTVLNNPPPNGTTNIVTSGATGVTVTP